MSVSSSTAVLQRRRTGWDVVFGALLVVGGLVILGDAALATKVSIRLVGWLALLLGLLALAASLFRIGRGGFWPVALTGGLLTVLGLFFLRHTGAAALTLTLIAGVVFLSGGIVRIMAAAAEPAYRLPLGVSGALSAILGLIVLLNLFNASLVLVGVLLGIQVVVDGLMLMTLGRWHVAR